MAAIINFRSDVTRRLPRVPYESIVTRVSPRGRFSIGERRVGLRVISSLVVRIEVETRTRPIVLQVPDWGTSKKPGENFCRGLLLV